MQGWGLAEIVFCFLELTREEKALITRSLQSTLKQTLGRVRGEAQRPQEPLFGNLWPWSQCSLIIRKLLTLQSEP